MARRKTKREPSKWVDYTVDEERALTLLKGAFGKLTYITREEFQRVWQRVEGAKTDRCPECMSWWDRRKFPKCGWCGVRAA